jgi:hypothetical protein
MSQANLGENVRLVKTQLKQKGLWAWFEYFKPKYHQIKEEYLGYTNGAIL